MLHIRRLFLFVFLANGFTVFAQITAGPMVGYVEYRTAKIWCSIRQGTSIHMQYSKVGNAANPVKVKGKHFSRFQYEVVDFEINGLEPGTQYEYQLVTGGKHKLPQHSGKFFTQELWNYRKPAPDFSFLTGSCNYTNESQYDRPGRPYGGDSSIFYSMAKEPSAFMLWLGDNWYYREVDYLSEWGLWYRVNYERTRPHLQEFLRSMSHYAIWDDHDFGSNDGLNSFLYKDEATLIFNTYWCNPAESFEREGIYTKLSYNDVDLFLLDDRSNRNADRTVDTSLGSGTTNKRMLGKKQMQWLKDGLMSSWTPFKCIVLGSQALNSLSPFECLANFPIEYNELLNFIAENKINGVIFFSGDRHHSEIISYALPAGYKTYDITVSPLTSGIAKVKDREVNHPYRVPGSLLEVQNYARISFSGTTKERKMKVEYKDIQGKVLFTWEIGEQDLRFLKK